MRKFFRRTSPTNEQTEPRPASETPLTPEEYEAKKRELFGQSALLSWRSPARPYHKRKRIFFVNVALLVLVVGAIVFLFGEYLLLAVILSLGFVVYVLAAVPPQEVEHKIVKDGIVSSGHAYIWRDLKSFWFSQKNGQEVLFIETRFLFPSRLMILTGEAAQQAIETRLSSHLKIRREPLSSKIERAGDWLVRKVPLE